MAIEFNKLGPISTSDSKVRAEVGSASQSTVKQQPGASSDSSETASAPEVALSPEAQMLSGPATGQSEIDAAKVERIRAAIAEGRYHVDPVRLAENFMNLEGQLAQ
jgi:negative regulator of flagellin synthesis FlgM